jgi:MFS-type transporter involved in bile tolerance (Atg22 family)
MMQSLKHFLNEWNSQTNQRIKLQKAYFFFALMATVVAGLVTLINIGVGQYIIMMAAFLAAVYFTNAIAWVFVDALMSKKIKEIYPAQTKIRPTNAKKK